jgi:DNA modification methylase
MKPLTENVKPVPDGVYDPFSGSGTMLIAAERTGCHRYALEIDPVFVDVILARWERFSGETAVRADG